MEKTIRYRFITLLLTLLFISCSSSQIEKELAEPKCKISDKYDEFNKTHLVDSGPYIFYAEEINLTKSTLQGFNYKKNIDVASTVLQFYIQAEWKDGKKIIGILKRVYRVQDYLEFAYGNSKIEFLLVNDEVLTLTSPNAQSSELSDDGWVYQWATFTIDDKSWSQLKKNPPTKFRIRYYSSNISNIYVKDFTIEEKFKAQIPFALNCIDNLNLTE